MAKALQQGLSKCIHQRVLLASTSVCTSNVNLKPQRASMYKKTDSVQEMLAFLQNRYRFTLQELSAYTKRRKRSETSKEILSQFSERTTKAEVAKFVMTQGGKVKFLDDDIWYQREEKGDIPVPARQLRQSHVEGIDATAIEAPKIWIEKICFPSLHLFRINNNTEFDDWCIHSLVENCPNLEALDIRGCTSVTDNGLEMLHKLRNLTVLDISGCTEVKCAEAVCALLLEFCPDLLMLGVETLQEIDQSTNITHYEQSNNRYLNWGYILDHRLGLKNCAGLESGHFIEGLSDEHQTDRITDTADRQIDSDLSESTKVYQDVK